MGRYVTLEDEIDRFLRAGVFVDLYAVVRHGIRASVESYSIKKLEPLYDFQRTVGLPDAGAILAKVQASLELGDFDGIGMEERAAVAGYNRDDCLSAWRLRDWLEKVRSELVASGATIERPGTAIWRSRRGLDRLAAKDCRAGRAAYSRCTGRSG